MVTVQINHFCEAKIWYVISAPYCHTQLARKVQLNVISEESDMFSYNNIMSEERDGPSKDEQVPFSC